jgi:hypothetical protein
LRFEVVGKISSVELVASGPAIREVARLERAYGQGRWRKLKGVALVRLTDAVVRAEIHWYEAHGVGRRELKIKRLLD